MAYKKRATTLDKINRGAQDTAIECHAGFVRLVVSLVKKHGYETIMSIDPQVNKELAWVKSGLKRVLDFAEEIQLKQIPNKLEGPGDNGEFKLTIEIADENNSSQESGNRISEYLKI